MGAYLWMWYPFAIKLVSSLTLKLKYWPPIACNRQNQRNIGENSDFTLGSDNIIIIQTQLSIVSLNDIGRFACIPFMVLQLLSYTCVIGTTIKIFRRFRLWPAFRLFWSLVAKQNHDGLVWYHKNDLKPTLMWYFWTKCYLDNIFIDLLWFYLSKL